MSSAAGNSTWKVQPRPPTPAARSQECLPQRATGSPRTDVYLIPYLLIAILLAAAAIRAPGFVSPGNLTQQLVLASYLGIVAGGQTHGHSHRRHRSLGGLESQPLRHPAHAVERADANLLARR